MGGAINHQLDYIYFFYGLACILLFSLCFSLRRLKQDLPWLWLGLFWLLHGLNEWMHIIRMSYGERTFLAFVHPLVQVISFLCLLEFGRLAIAALGSSKPSRYEVVAALGMAALSVFVAEARHALALASGIWAAYALFNLFRSEQKRDLSLVFASVAIAGYASVSGLVVPQASFFSAYLINSDTFLSALGFPIQLARGGMIFVFTASLWRYWELLRQRRFIGQERPISASRTLIGALCLLGLLSAGWVAMEWYGQHHYSIMLDQMSTLAKTSAEAISPERISRLSESPRDFDKLEYQRLRKQLRRIRETSGIVRIDIVGIRDGRAFFVVGSSSDGSDDNLLPGTSWERAPREMTRKWWAQKETIIFSDVDRRNKNITSIFVPIRGVDKEEPIAIMGIEISSEWLLRHLNYERLLPIGLTCLLILSVIAIFRHLQQVNESKEILLRDLTDRIRLEAKILSSENKYRRLFENAVEGIALAEADTGMLVDCNQAMCRMLERDKSELIGQHQRILHPPPSLKDGFSSTFLQHRGNKDGAVLDELVITRSGEIKAVSIVANVIQLNDKKYVQGMFRDVTEQRKVEGQLRYLSSFPEWNPNPITEVDLDGHVRYMNPSATRLLSGLNERNLAHPWLLNLAGMALSQCEDRTVVGTRDVTIDGRSYQQVLHYSAENCLVRIYGMDITERKRAEEQLRLAKETLHAANRSKGEFLTNMSHEIRTPMTAILGYVDLLSDSDCDEGQYKDYIRIVRRNGELLIRILDDILDLAKIEAGKTTIERVDCSVWHLADEILALLRIRAEQKKIWLKHEYEYPLPHTIHTDPVRLRQILLNLVGNAIKFTHGGGVTLRVSYTPGPGSGGQVHFAVTDTGIGMTADLLSRIFQPLTQGDFSTTRSYGGTGLGLTISKRLAQMLGGEIRVVSEPDKGSTFILTIDAGTVGNGMLKSAPTTPIHSEEPAASPFRVRGSVLLVEDSLENMKLIETVLKKAGLEVGCAKDGHEACGKAFVSQTAGKPYDLILMDIQMPRMDGYAATQHLRENGWRGPIIALTAHAMAGAREKCIQAGCDGYLSKPIDRRKLLTTVSGYLGQEPSSPIVSARLAQNPRLE